MKKESLQFRFFKFSLLTALMMVSALNYNIFINPSKIVSGGVNGVSIIICNFISAEPAIVIWIVSLSILIVGLFFSEYELVISALYTSAIYPLFVYLTSGLYNFANISNKEMIVVAIFSGIISGIVSGITCKLNTSQGGVILIAQIVGKYLKISVSKLNTFLSILIALLGGFIFGLDKVLYAIIFLTSNKIVMEKIIIGISQKKLFHIITNKPKEVKEYLNDNINRHFTTFKVYSGKDNSEKEIILTTIPTREYYKLKKAVRELDTKAFVLITDAYESKDGNYWYYMV